MRLMGCRRYCSLILIGVLVLISPGCSQPNAVKPATAQNAASVNMQTADSNSDSEPQAMKPPLSTEESASKPEDNELKDDPAIHHADAAAFYTIAHYDIAADPAQDLSATVARAAEENKHILLQVGGDWCGWCKLMTNYINENKSVNQIISENYLIQKVTYDSKNPNEEFLSKYPDISGYPHLFVLDSTGTLLHSQDTASLEEGKGYSQEAFVSFLNQWKPER